MLILKVVYMAAMDMTMLWKLGQATKLILIFLIVRLGLPAQWCSGYRC